MSDYKHDYYHNIYDKPERFGLEKVAELDISTRDYEFEIIGVWAYDGELYMGTDSGCSCPSPFENFKGKDELTGPLTADQVIEESTSLRNAAKAGRKDWFIGVTEENIEQEIAADWIDFESKVGGYGND